MTSKQLHVLTCIVRPAFSDQRGFHCPHGDHFSMNLLKEKRRLTSANTQDGEGFHMSTRAVSLNCHVEFTPHFDLHKLVKVS